MSSIKRKAHVLKSEKSLEIPRHLLFFDTETSPEKVTEKGIAQRLRLGWACYYRRPYGRHLPIEEWFYFDSDNAFWDFVYRHTHRKEKLWIIARNIVFDFTVVKGWSHLKQAGYKLKFFHNQGMTTVISIHKKDSSIVFLDSMNWFVESLAKTGERIGLPKLTIDFKTCSIEELSIYCHRDVEIEFENFKLFIKFLEENNVARLCYTRGSTAMSAFLLRHYTTKIYIHNNAEAIRLERESYKGGRCECFYIGELNNDTYYTLDVNSLYPFIMRNNLYPVKYIKILHNISLQELYQWLKNYAVVAKVLIDTDEPIYSVRRYRTLFPIGRFTESLCTPELKYGLAFKHIKRVDTAVIYEQENIFTSYVDKFYQLRQDFKSAGVAEYEELCKKMLNSLYGKFGQRGEEWLKVGDAPNEIDREELIFSYEGHLCSKIRYLLGQIFIMTGKGECFDSFPAIAAHVTAYGRMYLWGLMQLVGKGNYFYCDTDSLIVNTRGMKRLEKELSQTALGGLKVVEQNKRITIWGLKDYSTEQKSVIKGVRKNAVKIADDIYEQELWPSFTGLLRKGKVETYTVQTTTKHLYRNYTKGRIIESGSVVPLVFDDVVQQQF